MASVYNRLWCMETLSELLRPLSLGMFVSCASSGGAATSRSTRRSRSRHCGSKHATRMLEERLLHTRNSGGGCARAAARGRLRARGRPLPALAISNAEHLHCGEGNEVFRLRVLWVWPHAGLGAAGLLVALESQNPQGLALCRGVRLEVRTRHAEAGVRLLLPPALFIDAMSLLYARHAVPCRSGRAATLVGGISTQRVLELGL